MPALIHGRAGPAVLGRPADRARGRIEAKGVVLVALMLLILLLVAALSVAWGSHAIDPGTVWQALTAPDPRNNDHLLVNELRGPRTALGLMVGSALGLAGALAQSLTRNPLADPGLLGISSGAAVAVAAAIAFFGVRSPFGYVWFAFAGALAAAVLVYSLGTARKNGATPARMALAGAAVAVCLGAMTRAILLSYPQAFDKFRYWDVGSLLGRGYDVFWILLPFALAGIVIALLLARPLNALALGEEAAQALGVSLGATRFWVAMAVVLLAGSATAAAGPIAFIGLAVPHIARMLVGPDHRRLLPAVLLLSPVMLLGADVLGRVIVPPDELQTGIVTALLGAPVFIALVRSRKLASI